MVNNTTNGSKPLNYKRLESLESTSLKKYKFKAAGIMKDGQPLSTNVFLYICVYIYACKFLSYHLLQRDRSFPYFIFMLTIVMADI